ncbi:hypothetical protein DL770_005190 [Monosporascus sp. CRB-9-2]|nr:hypothetical protein DL770_005190 [Monosporascus sp. CRB-9-2]
MASSRSGRSNAHDSSDSDGGAPLHSATKATPGTHQETTKSSDPPTDDEMALVRASAAFGDLNRDNDPFAQERPQVPRSVPPMSNPYRQHVDFPPSNSSQPMPRYRQSISSNDSYGSGWASGASGASSAFYNVKPAIQQISDVQRRLMTTTQYIMVSPGVSSELAKKHQAMLQEISHMVNHFGRGLIRERDAAIQAKNEEHEKFKRALYDEDQTKAQRDKLQGELKLAMQQQQLLEERVEMYKNQIKMIKGQMSAMEEDAKRFREHHMSLCKNYEGQDEKHFDQILSLEEEIKGLRLRNKELAEMAGVSESQALVKASVNIPPSAPESAVGSKGKDDDASTAAGSVIRNKEKGPQSTTFVPNPQAPSWTPSLKSENGDRAPTPGPYTIRDGAKTPRIPAFQNFPDNFAFGSGHPSQGVRGAPSPFLVDRDGNEHVLPPSAFPPPGMESSANYSPFGPGEPFGSSGEEGLMANPHRKEHWNAGDVRTAIDRIYEMAKGTIVSNHKQGTPYVPDQMLSVQEPNTWVFLVNMVYPNKPEGFSHMKYLLSVPAYRPYILQRVILDYIFKKMIAPVIFLGFTPEMDQHLHALQDQISSFAHGNQRTTSRNRQRVIEEHARLVKAILAHPNAKKFRDETVDRHAQMLAMILRPMRNNTVDDETALKSLRILVKAAWNTSTKIWSSNMTLHYYFPECGTKFAMATMEALNGNHLASSPEHLQFAQYRISLVVAPTLTLRDDREAGLLKTFGIRKAEVLVMK